MSQSTQTIEPWLREILRCPKCKGELVDEPGPSDPELVCGQCHLAYPVESGIPVLLVDLARSTPA